ncbi:prolyl oligopeptidase family serine peptidase [Nocardioides caldifontis]|uniref:S9 family peptidase n=1 Tax=Nocardioides caldifontis TaxID=2588938 RepID=UPI0011DF2EEF|nr:prolyl oligopeptidase family serine peptidase [Nocardioides caldifontis]
MRVPCGSWPSPLSARDVYAADTVRATPQVDGGSVYWLEARPADAGRLTLVRLGADGPVDVSPGGMNVRTRFQEYGGGAYAVSGGLVLAVDFATQQVWRIVEGEEPRAVTPASGGAVRYSCFRIDHRRRAAFCLREDQRDETVEPVAELVRLDLDGPNDDFGTVVVAGRVRPRDADRELPATVDSPPDFLSDPVLSPDGRRVAWLSWNHPGMAWDGTWLHVGTLDETGDLLDSRVVAGAVDEAVEQPRWLDDDRLTFLTDRSGWSNHAVVDLRDETPTTVPLHTEEHDFGVPRWVPDISSYDVLPDGRLLTARTVDGFQALGVLDPGTGVFEVLGSPLTAVHDIRLVDGSRAVCRGHFRDRPAELVTVELPTGQPSPVVDPAPFTLDPGFVSAPEAVSWTSEDGATAHGFLYLPAHPEAEPTEGELPPLLVTLHGGPTAAARPAWSDQRGFWTSRGFAVLDVNYAGSTGYGRAYRKRLDGAWGVADVADVASGVRHLVAEGRVDPRRVAITGGSAGGFTTLACLVFTDAFAAGASHFGIGDLATLARDTHKLESRYLWGLVAPWPQGEEVYTARSPVHHLDRLSAPLILLQGTDDRVVPPAQAEQMAEALRRKGLPFALVMFEGEGHGFRTLEAQVRALESELSFYAQVFGFEPADDLEPVTVERP